MRSKTIIVLVSCLLGSVVIVVALAALYAFQSTGAANDSFSRVLATDLVTDTKVVDIKYDSYYIAGATPDDAYLGNGIAPLHLLKVNMARYDTQHIKLAIDSLQKYKLGHLQVKVEYPDFYIADGAMPAIFKGTVGEWRAKRNAHSGTYFTHSVPITPNSFAIRTLNTHTHEFALAKQSAVTPDVKFNHALLEKQVDGLFCTDGTLHYNRELKQLVYLYFYRNQFICMDTSLNLLYRGHTIDTTSHVKIKPGKISSANALTMAAPPLLVNKRSCVYGNRLFVHSGMIGKNEDSKVFNKSSVIDVYDLTDGEYVLSFYLDNYDRHKMKNLTVVGNKLIALYDHYMIVYTLSSKYFQRSTDSLVGEKHQQVQGQTIGELDIE
jgi:hypothetical protein